MNVWFDDKSVDVLTSLKVRFELRDKAAAITTSIAVLKCLDDIPLGEQNVLVVNDGRKYRIERIK